MRFKKVNKILRVPGASLKLNTTPIGNNTISANQTICNGGTPTALSGSLPTGSGSYRFTWQKSTNNSTWLNATGSYQQQNYSPPALTSNLYYRRIVTTAYDSNASSSILITVAASLSPGAIAGTGTGKAPFMPAPFNSIAPATGGVGTISYLWQRQYNGGVWSNAPGANTSTSYSAPTPLTPAGTYSYRRRASNTCGTVYSNVINITVTP